MAQAPPASEALPPKLLRALARVNEINSLPEITAKIVQMAEDPNVTAQEIQDVVRTDPALSAKILKVVNSAFYGLPAQVASVDRGILMLGLTAVKNIALAASLSRMFKAEGVTEQVVARGLWRHSVAVAVAARLLAATARYSQPDEAFVVGLMHDLGLILLQQTFPDEMRDVAELCQNQSRSFCAVETEIFGGDHQAFGAALAAKWKFPPALRAAIAGHHEPDCAPAEFRRITSLACLADTLCSAARLGFWLTAQYQSTTSGLLQTAGVTPPEVEHVVAELPARVEEAERILG